MTTFNNPNIPEGINVSHDHPLRSFFGLAMGALFLTVIVALVLFLLIHVLVRYIPFSMEVKLANVYAKNLTPSNKEIEHYLQELANQLGRAMDLPEGMVVQVHYVDVKTVNAFATLGGHVVIFRGLLEHMQSENALAMVVAHEMAHIKHRDPLTGLGRGLALATLFSAISAGGGEAMAQHTLGKAGLLTALSFNRSQESEADTLALSALAKTYGHVKGATDFFSMMLKLSENKATVPEFISTHPLTTERIQHLRSLAQKNSWVEEGTLKPLPPLHGIKSIHEPSK